MSPENIYVKSKLEAELICTNSSIEARVGDIKRYEDRIKTLTSEIESLRKRKGVFEKLISQLEEDN